MTYYFDKFTESNTNPVTGRQYDNSWRVIMLTDDLDYQMLCGSHNGCAYTVKISRLTCEDWYMRIGDFISFHEMSGKNLIVAVPETERNVVWNLYRGHSYHDPFLRKSEPDVLVHSTPAINWEQIRRDGMLKCWNRLKAENIISEDQPIGFTLGDPIDFSDYIMFGEGITGEIVVNSKQRGKIVMDSDAEYLTGARLYFDARKIAQDGLLIRDGCHLKVKDTLILERYLLWAGTWDTVGFSNPVSTPRRFAEACDRKFREEVK